ncbi:outer membrane beta-barrel protein [Pyxidicoccus sp. 3LG]
MVWLSAGGALAQEATPKTSTSESSIQPQLGLQLGYANGEDIEGGEHGGFGGRVQLLARFNRFIAVGPEVAYYLNAGSQSIITQAPGGGENSTTVNEGLLQLAGVLRLGFDDGPVRPSLLAGPALGIATSRTDVFYYLGMEMAFMVTEKLPLAIDARVYRPLTGSESGYPNYLSIGLGTRFSL